MMVIAPIQNTRMQIAARGDGKRLEEMRKQRGRDISNIRRVPFRLNDGIGTTRQVDGHMCQGFIHRRKAIAHADNAFAVAKRLVEGLSQRQGNIFHRVMSIDVQITFCLNGEIEQSMHGEMGQHVIEKTNACGDFMFASSIQIEFDLDLCFIGLT